MPNRTLPPIQVPSPPSNAFNQRNQSTQNEFVSPPSVSMLSPSTPASVAMLSPQTPMQHSPQAVMSPRVVNQQLSPNQQQKTIVTPNTTNTAINANNIRTDYQPLPVMPQQQPQQMSSYSRTAQMLPNANFAQQSVVPVNGYWSASANNVCVNNADNRINNCNNNTNAMYNYNQFQQTSNWNQSTGEL